MLVTCTTCKSPVFVSSAAAATGAARVFCGTCGARLQIEATGAVRVNAPDAPGTSMVPELPSYTGDSDVPPPPAESTVSTTAEAAASAPELGGSAAPIALPPPEPQAAPEAVERPAREEVGARPEARPEGATAAPRAEARLEAESSPRAATPDAGRSQTATRAEGTDGASRTAGSGASRTGPWSDGTSAEARATDRPEPVARRKPQEKIILPAPASGARQGARRSGQLPRSEPAPGEATPRPRPEAASAPIIDASELSSPKAYEALFALHESRAKALSIDAPGDELADEPPAPAPAPRPAPAPVRSERPARRDIVERPRRSFSEDDTDPRPERPAVRSSDRVLEPPEELVAMDRAALGGEPPVTSGSASSGPGVGASSPATVPGSPPSPRASFEVASHDALGSLRAQARHEAASWPPRQSRRRILIAALGAAAVLALAWVALRPGAPPAGSVAPSAHEAAVAHYRRANLLLAENAPAKAVEELHAALGLEPELGVVYRSLGVAFMQLGDERRAIEAYARFVELDPGHRDAGAARRIVEVYRKRILATP